MAKKGGRYVVVGNKRMSESEYKNYLDKSKTESKSKSKATKKEGDKS